MMIPWFVLVGAVLIVMALSSHVVRRLPLSPASTVMGGRADEPRRSLFGRARHVTCLLTASDSS